MDRKRLDRLAIKLFLAIAGTIAALTLATYFVFSSSFERGFVDYLHRADEARLEVLIDRLEEVYARDGSWASLVEDRERWIEMSAMRSVCRAADRRASKLRRVATLRSRSIRGSCCSTRSAGNSSAGRRARRPRC